MPYEQKDGDIAVFKNDKKGNEKAPDFKGTALINGVKMDVALWSKSNTMFAGSIKEKGADYTKREKRPTPENLEDEIPF